ncbi:hypothetical protein [Williamsia sp. D3]|uniref:hypothetical protein n=1 Tax=Williamsia sp. D3 TaxID=1313067 RepID=UPI0003D2AB13|nr:hypothetical protein [Williamsia sp. D3]ETD33997.1 methylamine dehydrogenase heavy chain [Williamsia sp. D3]
MNASTLRSRAAVALTVSIAAVLTVTSCSSSGDEAGTSTEVSYPSVPYGPPSEGTALETQDQEIGETIPEPLHVGEIEPIAANQLLAVEGGFGQLEVPVDVIDPATGEVTSRIVVGNGIWDPVIHGFVGKTSQDPAVLAAEVWRPRGSRGAADFTVSTYSGNLLEPREVMLPNVARVHSRMGSNAVTSDGKYFVTWDDGLFGIRVVDLAAGKTTGALRVVGCGPFTWMVGHQVYSVCEDSRELLQVTIGDDGVPTETARVKVLPDDFVSTRKVTWAADAKKALLVSENGDVFVFDFSNGLPKNPAAPIGNAGDDSGRFSENAINNDGTRIAVTYTDSPIHPDSARGGSVAKIVLSEAQTFAAVKTLTLADLGLTEFSSMTYSVDGKTLYVLGKGQEVDGTAPTKVVGIASATGDQVSSADISGNVDDVTELITPEVIG